MSSSKSQSLISYKIKKDLELQIIGKKNKQN
jgi:hypothetical protein